MYVDAMNTFSREQIVAGTGYSEKIIDTGERGIGDTDMTLHINTTTTVVGGNVTFALESADSEDFASYKTELVSREYVAAELTAEANPVLLRTSHIVGRYLRVKYTTSAALSAGAFTARMVEGAQTNR